MKKSPTLKTNLKRKKRHGFRRRMSSACGRAVLARRRRKGKKILCP